MQPEIERRFEIVERQRRAIESQVSGLSDAQLDWTPNAGVWSVRQIVEHLVRGEEMVGRAGEAGKIETEAPMFRIMPRAWRRALVLAALNRNMTLPLPSPVLEPQGGVPLSELLTRWNKERAEGRRLLEGMQGDETRYSHPVLGPLTVLQMLRLGEVHTAYHTRQIEALQRDAAFPCNTETAMRV